MLFTDDDHLNRNSLNRKVLIVSLETSLATRESLWVQFGDDDNFERVNANVLEPIRLVKEGDVYKTLFPEEVLTKPGIWYMTFAVRMYSTGGVTFSEQLTSDKVSFSVNDSYPLGDDGYVSNATIENIWQQIEYSIDVAEQNASSAKEAAKSARESEINAASSEENAKFFEENAEQSAILAKASADNLASMLDRTIKFVPELPERGNEEYIYAIVSNANGNLFDLYSWINGERYYFGSANLVTDTDKQFYKTLKADGWKNSKQYVEIVGLSNASKIFVTPIDSSAAQYLNAGIELSTDENTLVFTCKNCYSQHSVG